MKKLIIKSLIILFFASQLKAQDWQMPYENFGINYLSSQINDTNKDIYNQYGIEFFYDYFGVIAGNPSGGNDQGTNYTQLMFFGVKADLDKIMGWNGGTFVVSGSYASGANLSSKIGNFFTISEAFAENGTLFYQMYIKQHIDHYYGQSDISFGRISMSQNFASLPVFGLLVSGGINSTPEAIFNNSPYTSGPSATWGIVADYNYEEYTFAMGGYQVPETLGDSNYPADMSFRSNDGYMFMYQFTWSPEFKTYKTNESAYSSTYAKSETKLNKRSSNKQRASVGLEGEYQIGGYLFENSPLTYSSFDSPISQNADGYGFYLQAQQMVWRNPNLLSQYALVWLGMQYAPEQHFQIMPYMIYSGVQLQGFIPSRSEDSILFSCITGIFSDDYDSLVGYNSTYEMVLELTYVYQLNKNISIQPDLQYIINPYGDSSISNAFVVGGQICISF